MIARFIHSGSMCSHIIPVKTVIGRDSFQALQGWEEGGGLEGTEPRLSSGGPRSGAAGASWGWQSSPPVHPLASLSSPSPDNSLRKGHKRNTGHLGAGEQLKTNWARGTVCVYENKEFFVGAKDLELEVWPPDVPLNVQVLSPQAGSLSAVPPGSPFAQVPALSLPAHRPQPSQDWLWRETRIHLSTQQPQFL